MPESLDALLTSLESAKSRYGQIEPAEINSLLAQLETQDFDPAKSLLRFHEALLFLRAFPHQASLVPRIEKLLNTFDARIEKLTDLEAFDDFDTSGIAGTTMQDALNFEAARWLGRRIPRNVEIAWDDYEEDRAMGCTWPRFVPLLEEDADVEANIPWRRWLDTARGRTRDLEFLISRFAQLPVTPRARAELYDSLRIPLRWHLRNLKISRTRNWTRPRKLFVHTSPLITRSQVSLDREFSRPTPRLTKLSRREGEKVMRLIREVMVVRYRELYGTALGDPASVVRTDLGRGVTIYLWNLPAERRLPLRAYVAGFTLKNGVPINYIEAIGLCEWIEVGFNTFYTYRHGETAWIYAQALRALRVFTAATTISVYPYQIGQNNDEAIDSGAFWFYRKLGFRSGNPELELLARREEKKIAANPKYRTQKKMLKRLAEAHVFYEITSGLSPTAEESGLRNSRRLPATPGPWDTFSTRNLGLRVNRRMARESNGDSDRIRSASMVQVARALGITLSRWSAAEVHSFENWSLLLALIPNLSHWPPKEKQGLVEIIRAQAATNEMHYLRLTQNHLHLRAELLRLGADPPS